MAATRALSSSNIVYFHFQEDGSHAPRRLESSSIRAKAAGECDLAESSEEKGVGWLPQLKCTLSDSRVVQGFFLFRFMHASTSLVLKITSLVYLQKHLGRFRRQRCGSAQPFIEPLPGPTDGRSWTSGTLPPSQRPLDVGR